MQSIRQLFDRAAKIVESTASLSATEIPDSFPAEVEFSSANLRIFMHGFVASQREMMLKAVDEIYQKILSNRRAAGLVHALDDYLLLLRAGPEQVLIDEELERDGRVCRTLVWNVRTESVAQFLQRTPFAALPAVQDQQQTLQSIFKSVSIDLAPWLRLGASDMEDSSLDDWLAAFDASRGLT
jgi:hypothetical protein